MKQYEYYRFHPTTSPAMPFSTRSDIEKEDVLNDYARRGFRYVGYIPIMQDAGMLTTILLIFEREKG